jgi:hypothetical protein
MPSVSADNISALTSAAAATHEGAQSIRESQSKRAHFTIDPATDPLVTNGEGAVRDPHKTMAVAVVEETGGASVDTYVACDEAGEDYSGSCKLSFQPRIVKTYGRIFLRLRVSGHSAERGYYEDFHPHPHTLPPTSGFDAAEDENYHDWVSGCNVHCIRHQNQYRFYTQTRSMNEDGTPALGPQEVIDKPTFLANRDKEEVIQEEAELSDCAGYEALADAGHCQYGERVCIEGEETRTIAGVPIHRSCWAYRRVYSCQQPSVTGCAALRAQGCVQVTSHCAESEGGHCVRYTQVYRCPSGEHKAKTYRAEGDKVPFCLIGNCQNVSYKANEELLAVLSHMAMLKEAQEDIRAQVGIFKGQTRVCTKNCVGFRDCCGVARGWGVSLGLAGCSGEEEELAKWRGENKCVFVGTYCAEKLAGTGKCIRKKSSFCCFGTKLSRLAQEQGRRQLGMGWGSAEGPDCRGLRPDELGRLDFSRMDLRELYEEVRARFKAPTPEALQGRVDGEALKANMARLTAKAPPLGGAARGGGEDDDNS